MDVLGLLANISQVVDLLIKIGIMCSIYCADVKKAPKDVRKLLNEVDRLTAVIKELEFLLKSPKGSSQLESPALRQAVFDLRKLLAELVAKLDLGIKHVRAVWPFRKREIHEIFAAIERQKANILLNINVEQTSILLDIHQEIVLSKLRVADGATFDASTDGEASFCLEGTRSRIIEEIQDWSTRSDSQPIFWLNGSAGTGKSTISRTIAQSLSDHNILGASFFFKRGEGDRGRTAFLFTTIAAQLVRLIPSLAPRIRDALDLDPQIHDKPLSDQFQKLILDPLKNNLRSWSPSLVIVIDALDECGAQENMRILINALSEAKQTDNPQLKFFITSRPELPIRLGFEEISGKYDHLLLATVSTPTITHDIELFMRHQLDVIKSDYNKSVTEHRKMSLDWPGDDIIEKLVASAIPLFIVAATICRFLKDRRLGNPHRQLTKILEYQRMETSGLDMTYLPVLNSLFADLPPSSKEDMLVRFRYLIGTIVILAQPLSIRSLAHLLDISTDTIEDQLDLLHSVLGVPTDLDTPVRLLHLSFRDFLVDSDKKLDPVKYPFWIQEPEAHSKVFSQCLLLLSAGVLKEDICFLRYPGTLRRDVKHEVIDEYLPNAVQYACLYWVHHLSMSNRTIHDNDETHKFLAIYLLNWLEALSLIGRITESFHMLDDLLLRLEGTNAQNIKSLLQDVKRFILANVSTVDKAPLQIYSSALIFAPKESIVRHMFKTSIPSWLHTQPTMQSHWNPCLATIEDQAMSYISVLAIPAGDTFLSVPYFGGDIKIWDTKTTSCIETHGGVLPKSVRVSSDGKELYYISGHQTLQIMAASTRSCIEEYSGHTDEIICAMFSADGQQFASASKDGTLRIWDRAFRESIAIYDYEQSDKILGFSPDGQTFLTISNFKIIRLLNSRATGLALTIDDHKANVKAVIFSPNSQRLVSLDGSGTIRFLDRYSGKSLVAEGAASTTCGGLIYFSDSIRVISSMRENREKAHAICIWNSLEATCDSLLEGHRAAISEIVISKAEDRIASASYDKSIRVWDVHSGTCIGIYDDHDDHITSLTYSAAETLLISVDIKGTYKIWDTNIERPSTEVESHESAVLEVVFSSDKKRVVTTSGDRTVRLWDAVTGKCLSMDADHRIFASVPLVIPQDILSTPFDSIMNAYGLYGWPRSVEFSPDSSVFLSASGGAEASGLKLWSTTTGDCQILSDESMLNVRSIAFSPDGTTITSTSADGVLRYWDIATRRLLDSIGGEAYGISSSIYSANGTQLILACDDGFVRLFHLLTRDCKDTNEAHERPVKLVTLSGNGSKLASYDMETVKIWEVNTLSCIATYTTDGTSSVSQMLFSPDERHLFLLHEAREIKIEVLSATTGYYVDQIPGVCGLANHMAFDPSVGSGLRVITNVGTFELDPGSAAIGVHARPSFSDQRAAHTRGLGLSKDGEWITWDSRNILWLPPTFRISASDIDATASLLALGTRLGRLLFIGIDSSKMPANLLDATQRPLTNLDLAPINGDPKL